MPAPQERRNSERISLIRACPYQLSNLLDKGRVELSTGYSYSLNISSGGMLLLMPHMLPQRQIFEVNAPSVGGDERHITLVEVCWTRPTPPDLGVYFVGVRFLFTLPSQ